MLYRPPDFRARGAELFRDARATDDDRCVIAQQANDTAEPSVSGAVGGGVDASWWNAGDTRIMPLHSRKSLARIEILLLRIRKKRECCAQDDAMIRLVLGFSLEPTAEGSGLLSYAGIIRMLRSTACTECVSAPTEMKSTPVSA